MKAAGPGEFAPCRVLDVVAQFFARFKVLGRRHQVLADAVSVGSACAQTIQRRSSAREASCAASEASASAGEGRRSSRRAVRS
ncbi:hypothetical protein [Deinococcus proteolyticus]|uniref:hypothetical protein n=1 Tax=Deinococcus proteolyticus TaxID=55148 RepID=UPI001576A9C3|nr:hypothetical protein [Deinococcus proteolyticus]